MYQYRNNGRVLDYKDWMTEKADELALEEHGCMFHELTPEQSEAIWSRVGEAHANLMPATV